MNHTVKRPNIVFMMADDQRFDTLHAWGNDEIRTPVLDSLVHAGASFRTMYTTGGLTPAICVPSRACALTGTHALTASQNRRLNHWPGLMTINPELVTLPQLMRENGYHTFGTGKWHNDRQSFVRGFADGAKIFFGGMSEHTKVPVYDFDPTGEYDQKDRYIKDTFSTDLFADAAAEFIRGYDRSQPFFLYLAFTSPHDPRTAPEPFAEKYRPEDVSLPSNFMQEHPFDNGEMTVRDELLAAIPRDPDEIRRHIADYYAMIAHMDDRIGNVLQALRDTEQLDDTIIIYTADHGLALGQHGLMGKQNLYDHSIRIPAVMAGPGIPQGEHFTQVTSQADIFPTLCDLVHIPIPQNVEGKSLVPLMNGKVKRVRDTVFAVYKDLQRMVCDGQWKLIRYYRPEEHNYGSDRIQLFHLPSDPWEMNDLSEDERYAAELERLAQQMTHWQQRASDPWAYRPVMPPKAHEGIWGNWND